MAQTRYNAIFRCFISFSFGSAPSRLLIRFNVKAAGNLRCGLQETKKVVWKGTIPASYFNFFERLWRARNNRDSTEEIERSIISAISE